MNYNRQTACVHLYMHPETKNAINIFVDGKQMDLMALLISAARMDNTFHDAFIQGAEWLRRDEARAE